MREAAQDGNEFAMRRRLGIFQDRDRMGVGQPAQSGEEPDARRRVDFSADERRVKKIRNSSPSPIRLLTSFAVTQTRNRTNIHICVAMSRDQLNSPSTCSTKRPPPRTPPQVGSESALRSGAPPRQAQCRRLS